MKPGDLIFVKGKGPVSETIELVDGGPFSHVAMAMPFDTVTESQYLVNTRDIANPYKEGITVLDLGFSDEERQKLVNCHFAYLSYKYDLKQIFGIFFHDVLGWPKRPWINKNELICSRYMVCLLQDVWFFKKHAWFNDVSELTPNSLFNVLNTILKTNSEVIE